MGEGHPVVFTNYKSKGTHTYHWMYWSEGSKETGFSR